MLSAEKQPSALPSPMHLATTISQSLDKLCVWPDRLKGLPVDCQLADAPRCILRLF